jgi:PTS system galactitol-specific IIA component
VLAIEPAFILLDYQAEDAKQVILALSKQLEEHGVVESNYGEETLARELKHPTGLPTKPFAIAFPHAEAEGVFISSLAVAALKNPVDFLNMGDPDETLKVELVFLLANKEPEEQVQALRQLALIFSNSEKLIELRNMTSAQLAADWLREELLGVQ